MKLSEISASIEGRIVNKVEDETLDFECAMASDLMSDVLTLETDKALLITGLANLQTIRTAEMSDVHCIVLARNKKASDEMKDIASQNGIVLMETTLSMYQVSGILYGAGLKPIY